VKSATRLRDFGPVDAPLYLLARLLRRLPGNSSRLFKYRFWSQPVPEGRLLPKRPGAVSIRPLQPGDPVFAQLPRDAALIAERLASGDICLGAVRGERLVASMWIATRAYHDDEVRARFEPRPHGRAVWDYDIFILPEERGGLLFARLWDAAYELMRDKGYSWSLSRISSFNLTSTASQARMGARPVGWGVFLILFNCQLTISSIAPRLHVALPGRAGPALAIDAVGRDERQAS
jgi:GNAT superfamily N-acetyltransferase